jgi:AcrR family transcriptional regulator
MDGVNMAPRKAVARRAYHHGDLRRVLVDAAFKLLDRDGIDGVTVRAVAREADVAHSAPANHFADRTALLTQLAVDVFTSLNRSVEDRLAQGGSHRGEQLHAFADAVLGYAWRHPHRYRLLWRRDCVDHDHPGFQAAGGALYDRLRQILSQSRARPQLSVDTGVVAAWSLVHGYISLRLDGTLIAAADEVSGQPREHAVIDALLAGIG